MISIKIYGLSIMDNLSQLKNEIISSVSDEFNIGGEDSVEIDFPSEEVMDDIVLVEISGLPSSVGVANDLFKEKVREKINSIYPNHKVSFLK